MKQQLGAERNKTPKASSFECVGVLVPKRVAAARPTSDSNDLDGAPAAECHRLTKSGGLRDDPLDNAGADTERPGSLENAVTFGPQFSYRRLDRRLDPSPAKLRTVLPCPRQPGVDALPYYAAFKFRKHAQHLEHGLTRGGRGIEPLLMQRKINAFDGRRKLLRAIWCSWVRLQRTLRAAGNATRV
jgi:hypothetical protein